MKLKANKLFKRAQEGERGQVIVMFVIFSSLIFLAAMVAIDLGTYVYARQKLEVAVDAAALAGGLELPDSGTAARSKAVEYIGLNDPAVDPADIVTTYRCMVGDRNGDGNPDPSDIPAVCDPGTTSGFACADGLCVRDCEFTGSNRCNILDVSASKDVELNFTRILGMPPILVSASQNGACRGFCGAAPNVPLDVIIVIDRSGSMSSSELQDAEDGALAVLQIFDPNYQHVGLAVLGAGDPGDLCDDLDPNYGGNWLIVPLSDDYKDPDDTLNYGSDLVTAITCLSNSSQGTNLGSPLKDDFYGRSDAITELLNSSRDVAQGIIFLSDGAANEPDPMPGADNPCQYAEDQAQAVKDEDIEIFTIGYGVQNEYCNDESGTYDFERVTELLANMATDSADDQGHCSNSTNVAAENSDGDHFLCQAKGDDLEIVFISAAEALTPGIRLVGEP